MARRSPRPPTLTGRQLAEADVVKALRKRYPAGPYAMLTQVRNATGYARLTRTADAVVMSLWPSRGLDLTGIEVKVNRGDWLAELRAPHKADVIASYCDLWVVAAAQGVVDLMKDPLPEPWGVLELRGGVLYQLRGPKHLDPEPLDRPFLAALLRQSAAQITEGAVLNFARKEGYDEGYAAGKEAGEATAGYERKNLEEEAAAWRTFRQRTGLDRTWILNPDPPRIAGAVKLLLDGDTALSSLEERAQTILAACQQARLLFRHQMVEAVP